MTEKLNYMRNDNDIYADLDDRKKEETRNIMARMSIDRAEKMEALRFKKREIPPIDEPIIPEKKTPAYMIVKEKIEWINLMRSNGFTLEAIAEDMDVVVSTLSKMLRRIRKENLSEGLRDVHKDESGVPQRREDESP